MTRSGAVSGRFCTGQGISAESAYEEMIRAKSIFHNEKGKQYEHLVISCDQKMKDPDIVHKIGMRIAEYYHEYQVLTATHDDTPNLHSHLIINSVNMCTGKKLSMKRKDLWALIRYANKVFEEYGLPPIGSKQVYEIIPTLDCWCESQDDYYDDGFWDDFMEEIDAAIDERLEELQLQLGIQRVLSFDDPDEERKDKIRSILRMEKGGKE